MRPARGRGKAATPRRSSSAHIRSRSACLRASTPGIGSTVEAGRPDVEMARAARVSYAVCLMSAPLAATIDVLESHRFDVGALERYMERHLAGFRGPLTVR